MLLMITEFLTAYRTYFSKNTIYINEKNNEIMSAGCTQRM